MTNTPKNIWIFGGTGFIGSALTQHLLKKNGYLLNFLLHKKHPGKLLELCNTFVGSLESFDLCWLQRYPPSIIFHLARISGNNAIARCVASYKGAKANQRLIDFLFTTKQSPIVVYVSGSLMYGHQQNGAFADELTDLSPISYARQYSQGEQPWIDAQKNKLLDVRFARPGWIVGPDSWFKAFYWNHYDKHGTVPLYGGGENIMSLVDVDDCAAQILCLAEKGKPFTNLNIFTGLPVTQNAFVHSLANFLHAPVEKISVEKLRLRFGKAASEAFTSSIPLQTCYPEIKNGCAYSHNSVESMIQKTISLLKNKQRVLAKLP